MDELKLSSTEICESFKEGEKLTQEISKCIDMKLLLEKIKQIKNQVIELEQIIGENKKILEKYPDKLGELSQKYKDKRIEIISLNLHEVFILIRDNLPMGIHGDINDNDMYLTIKKETKVILNKKETLKFTEIGKVIRVNSEKNIFKVIIDEEKFKKYEEEFELDCLARVYKIVTSINTNILYKE